MGVCVANCGTCDLPATQLTLGDCIADADVGAGTRAADVINRECVRGVDCSRLQQQVLAHCIKDCVDCNRQAVSSVVGSCAIQGHESAMNLLRATCDQADDASTAGMFASLAGRPPPPPCSVLQGAIGQGCLDNCVGCNRAAVDTVISDCVDPVTNECEAGENDCATGDADDGIPPAACQHTGPGSHVCDPILAERLTSTCGPSHHAAVTTGK